jgi:hypothetical protein
MKGLAMPKKLKTTYDTFLESMTSDQKKEFDNELRNLALSEFVLAAMKQDTISVRKLAKIAGVSPTIIQAMRSGSRDDFALKSIFKVLDSLGFKVLLERNGEITPLDISWIASD